jgi:hypothetical protein
MRVLLRMANCYNPYGPGCGMLADGQARWESVILGVVSSAQMVREDRK